MKEALLNLWHRVVPLCTACVGAAETAADPRENIRRELDAARGEWQAARSYFEVVTDPSLVDHAIATLDAAEKKYIYLLRRAREEGLSVQNHLLELR